MKAIMEHANHPKVGVTWNSNPTDVKNGSVAEYFKLLSPWIRSCHINELYKDAAGTYPYRELFKLFRGMGYDRYTMCEVGKSYDVVEGTAFLKKYKTKLSVQYGTVLKEYVDVPDALLQKTEELKKFFDVSYAYVGSLKPKPTKGEKKNTSKRK